MMKIERGNFQVVLACCTSGNCTRCLAGWNKARRKRVVHIDRLSEESAKAIAANWHAYDPTVELMNNVHGRPKCTEEKCDGNQDY